MAEVVDFAGRKAQKEAVQQHVMEAPEIPADVIAKTALAEKHVEALVDRINETIIAYANEHDNKLDITIPIDALTRTAAFVALDLDRKIDPAIVGLHHEKRDHMIRIMTDVMNQLITSSSSPVVTQDVYLTLSNVLIEFANRYRYFSIVQEHHEGGDASESGAEQSADAHAEVSDGTAGDTTADPANAGDDQGSN